MRERDFTPDYGRVNNCMRDRWEFVCDFQRSARSLNFWANKLRADPEVAGITSRYDSHCRARPEQWMAARKTDSMTDKTRSLFSQADAHCPPSVNRHGAANRTEPLLSPIPTEKKTLFSSTEKLKWQPRNSNLVTSKIGS